MKIIRVKGFFLWNSMEASLSIKLELVAPLPFGILYNCGIRINANTEATITLIAANIPRSLSALLFTKIKHKNATAVVLLLIKTGLVTSL